MLFIGHRLEEVFAISDRITVLRDGEVVGSRLVGRIHAGGARRGHGWPRKARPSGDGRRNPALADTLLEVHGLSRSGVFKDISFNVGAGEIVGMAGLVGAGRSEIARAAFGVDAPHAGSVAVCGKHVARRRPERRDQGAPGVRARGPQVGRARRPASRLPEHRRSCSPQRWDASAGCAADKERLISAEWFRQLDVRAKSVMQPVSQLSGGNQQKVVLAKWLATDPKVLILDEPTRGVDVGAKGEIHRWIDGLAQQGLGILVISSDLRRSWRSATAFS